MKKILNVVLVLGAVCLLAFGEGHSKVKMSDYFGGFSYNCKHNPAKDWSYDYNQSTLEILIGNTTYESVVPESFLDNIPRNKKLSTTSCNTIKQNLIYQKH